MSNGTSIPKDRPNKVAVHRTKVTWMNAAAFQHPYVWRIQTFEFIRLIVILLCDPLKFESKWIQKVKPSLFRSKLLHSCIAMFTRGSPIPLCKTQSRKNISPFQASRIIFKILSRSRKIRDDHVSRKNKNEIH